MDSNDFIFSDDVAESLGARMAAAEKDVLSAEDGASFIQVARTGFNALGGLAFGIVSFMTLLER